MTASELISRLQTMLPDAEVWSVWDGAARSTIDHVWFTRDGRVLLCAEEHPVYGEEDRPEGAPSQKENVFWETASVTQEQS